MTRRATAAQLAHRRAIHAEAIAAADADANGWRPIATAPKNTELLVGRWVGNEWRICQSGHYFEVGYALEGEPSYWFWCSDWDAGSVTDDDGPTHWQPLPEPPSDA